MRRWFLSPKQNGSLSKNNHCKRKKLFLPDNYYINASTKILTLLNAIWIITSYFQGLKVRHETVRNLHISTKKNVWKIVSLSCLPQLCIKQITLLTIQECTVQFSFISNLITQHFYQKLSLVFSVTEFEFCARHLDSLKCSLCCIMLKTTNTPRHSTQSTSPT